MKFYGTIGFWEDDVEVKPGIYKSQIVEKTYFGDVNWDNRHFVNSGNQNDDLKLNSQIGVLADLYFQQNFSSIKYVVWGGAKWKVTNVAPGYPRSVLTIGGVYNDSDPTEGGDSKTIEDN